jgi:uncharacterized delta-60 repeat protein
MTKQILFGAIPRACRTALHCVGSLLVAAQLANTSHAAPGELDTAGFATPNGFAFVEVGALGTGRAAAQIQSDGKLLIAGHCEIAASVDFCIVRYNTDGTLDETFGNAGKVTQSITASSDFGLALAIQPNGRFLVAGECAASLIDTDFCAARFLANGELDTSFGGVGFVRLSIGAGLTAGSSIDRATKIVVQNDNKIVLAGYCAAATGNRFCMARYSDAGVLDSTFDGDGIVYPSALSTDDRINAIAIQTDGKIVLAGNCLNGTTANACVARFNGNGTLDDTFGTTGAGFVPLGSGSAEFSDISLTTSGEIVVVGRCIAGGSISFCAARLTASGALDTNFGSGGVAAVSFDAMDATPTATALQANGKIVLAGYCSDGLTDVFCLARLSASGSLDLTFNTTGRVTTTLASNGSLANDVLVQSDGKIVAVGECNTALAAGFCVARYEGDPVSTAASCLVDIDGDGTPRATIDSLIHVRIALGLTGDIVVSGINFPAAATRQTWATISPLLGAQNAALDIDGDGTPQPATDSMIHARVAMGFRGDPVVDGLPFSGSATRTSWTSVRTFLNSPACGLSLP